MSLSTREVDLIRESFEDILMDPEEAAAEFYVSLFERDPTLRELFVEDMENQGGKLINTLGVVVAQLDTLDSMLPVLHDLALRHVAYGVRAEHYEPVGAALGEMIAKTCTIEPIPECTAAWEKAYSQISSVMIEMAYPDEAVAS